MQDGFWQEMEERRSRWNVLTHPFYERWAVGELVSGELAIYASEYEHGASATAAATARTAHLDGGRFARAAIEEAAHVSCWRSFAKATGWGATAWAYGEEPLPETVECAEAWQGDELRTLPEHLVTLQAIATAEAAVSEVMLNGLLRHYGFEAGPSTAYFSLHGEGGGSGQIAREALDPLLPNLDHEALLEQAETVHRSYWLLLDGVESLAHRTCHSY